jgi:hypothetical protein
MSLLQYAAPMHPDKSDAANSRCEPMGTACRIWTEISQRLASLVLLCADERRDAQRHKGITRKLAPDWHQQDSDSKKSVIAIAKIPTKLVGRVGLEPTTKGL